MDTFIKANILYSGHTLKVHSTFGEVVTSCGVHLFTMQILSNPGKQLHKCNHCTSNQSPFSELQRVYQLLNQSYHLIDCTRIKSMSVTLHGGVVISSGKLKSWYPASANIYRSDYIQNWPGITVWGKSCHGSSLGSYYNSLQAGALGFSTCPV